LRHLRERVDFCMGGERKTWEVAKLRTKGERFAQRTQPDLETFMEGGAKRSRRPNLKRTGGHGTGSERELPYVMKKKKWRGAR